MLFEVVVVVRGIECGSSAVIQLGYKYLRMAMPKTI